MTSHLPSDRIGRHGHPTQAPSGSVNNPTFPFGRNIDTLMKSRRGLFGAGRMEDIIVPLRFERPVGI